MEPSENLPRDMLIKWFLVGYIYVSMQYLPIYFKNKIAFFIQFNTQQSRVPSVYVSIYYERLVENGSVMQ